MRAGGSPLPDYDAVPVRRAPLPPRAALAPFFPSSSPTLGVSLPSSRADRAVPNPPDASPCPHLTRRRRSAVSEPGSDPVACGSATSTFRATSVATRACATSSKSSSGTRATGVGSSPHAAHGDEQLCHLRLRSDETRAPDGTVTLGLSFSERGTRCEGLIDVDGVIRGGVGQLVRPEEDFWQDATPENTFTLRVASCAAAGGDRDRDRDRDAHAVRSRVRRLARWKIARWFFRRCLRRWRRSTATRGTSKPPCAPPRNSCARLVSSTSFTSRPGSSRVCSAPRARQPRSCGRNRRRRKRGRRRRRSRVSRRTSRRIRRITWRRIP